MSSFCFDMISLILLHHNRRFLPGNLLSGVEQDFVRHVADAKVESVEMFVAVLFDVGFFET